MPSPPKPPILGDGDSPQIHPDFPDPESCRVRPSGFGNYYDRVRPWSFTFPAALYFGGRHLCRHVKLREVAKWKALPAAKPAKPIPPSRFSIQLATTGDVSPLAALHTAVAEHLTDQHGQGPWSSKTSERGVQHAMCTSRVFVARLGAEIVGTLRLATKKPWAIDTSYFTTCRRPLYLLAMAVTPVRQHQGIGRLCLQEALRMAEAWPVDAIRLDAYDAKAGGGGFYARCGWTERGRISYRGAPLIYYEHVIT